MPTPTIPINIFSDLDETLVNITLGWLALAFRHDLMVENIEINNVERVLFDRTTYDIKSAFIHPKDHERFTALYFDNAEFYQNFIFDINLEKLKLISKINPHFNIDIVSKTPTQSPVYHSKKRYLEEHFGSSKNVNIFLIDDKLELVKQTKDKYNIFLEDDAEIITYLMHNTRPDQVIYAPKYGYNAHLIDGKKVMTFENSVISYIND
jgi:hypothetical protein